jgi:hypothetical protein
MQRCRDLTDRHVGIDQQVASNLKANLARHLSERPAFGKQVSAQGAATDRKMTRSALQPSRRTSLDSTRHTSSLNDLDRTISG